MKGKKKYLLLVAACASMAVSAVAFTACGDTHTHGTLVKTDEVPATCTENGAEQYWTCPDCEKMFSDSAAQHEIKAVVVIPAHHTLAKTDEDPATCTQGGTEAYWSCSVCEKKFSDENAQNEIEAPVAISAKGHGTLKKTNEDPASCTHDGAAAYWSCPDCGQKFSDENGQTEIEAPAVIPAHHTLEKTEGDSCMDAYWTCSVCEKLFSDANAETEITAPVFHHTGEMIGVEGNPPSCMYPGSEGYWYCNSCYKMFSDAEGNNRITELVAIPERGYHGTITEVPEVPSTCTDAGTSAYWVCEDCHMQFSDAKGTNQIDWADPLPLAPHSYADEMDMDGAAFGDIIGYACEECGALDPARQYTYIDNSVFDEVIIDVEAGKYYVDLADATDEAFYLSLNLVSGPYKLSISDVTNGTATISEVLLNGQGDSLGQGNEFTFDATDHADDHLEIELTLTGTPTFIISVEGEISRALSVGSNTIKVTVDDMDEIFWDLNGAGWDVYTFASETAGIYTITVPKGVEVGVKNPDFDPEDWFSVPVDVILEYDYDDPEEVSVRFRVGSEPVELCFRCNQITKGKYSVTIEYYGEGEEDPDPEDSALHVGYDGICFIDATSDENTLTVGDDVVEGEYILSIEPMSPAGQSATFTVEVNEETYTLSGANSFSQTITLTAGDTITVTTTAVGAGEIAVMLMPSETEEEA